MSQSLERAESRRARGFVRRLLKRVERVARPRSKRQELEVAEENRLRKLPRRQVTVTVLNGRPFKVADALTFLEGKAEILERQIYRFRSRSSSPLIIDCGANIGLSVLYFKQLYPDATVIAFEPDPDIYEVLVFNIEAQGLDGLDARQAAVWNESGNIEFWQEGGYSGRVPKGGDEGVFTTVPTADLRAVIGSKRVDFLKLDIEGAELVVLRACKSQLPEIDHIFVEYHSHESEPQCLHEILAMLSEAGFRYHIHEAYRRRRPYVDRDTMLGMDLQLNIYGYREER